ncbi:MAG TPA: gfo/Idh/MocA family oxidoreductase [Anaerolinea thermolimosa]|uniref:Gfo/Idh/MocA family oxidoreductase n=1 Tax=Anaerolinea thermolimosa TaxID=229919 RepID=A0A3D1JFN0_9CHLR|nr:gfo/Idh/MocA family oxidoreductase [Anaerolinea thermolimosa]
MEKLRIGVIGLGMGRHHIAGYQAHPGAEVVAAADVDEKRLNEICDQYHVPHRYTSAQQMLEEEKLDLVSVATPNKFHRDLTVAALEAGCHVLCEKPMAMSAAEGREMLAAAQKAGKRLMINFSYRFSEQSRALKQQVDSGILGDVYFARTVWHRRRGLPGFGGWFGQKALSGGGPLIDLGVHRLDLALWLMGYPRPVWVLGSTYNPIGSELAARMGKAFDVEDLAVGLIKFANGATLVLEASWAANIKESELMETRLYGTKAGLVQRNVDETYKFEAEIYLEKDGAQFDMKLHPPLPGAVSSYYHFVDAILNDRPHMATGEEGLLVMEILDALYRSAAEGGPVQIV